MTTTALRNLLLVATSLFAAPSLLAQGWSQFPTSSGPPARNSHAMCYDIARGVTVLFGGYTGPAQGLADTWEWNGFGWVPGFALTAPVARWGHGMAYDSRRLRTVLFGGYSPITGTWLNDTWEWDGASWTQRTVAQAPTARGYLSMAYDSWRGRTVVYGGDANGPQILDDAWGFDGTNWTLIATSGPGARRGAAMAFDDARGQMLVFGGGDGATVFGDTWTLDGGAWTQRTPSQAPGARWEARLGFDTLCGEAVLHGGADVGYTTDYGDSWSWDGADWTPVGGASPSPRHGGAMSFDAQRGQMLGFGGRDAGGFFADTWLLGSACSRTMSVVTPPQVGSTAAFRYDYPAAAAGHLYLHLMTAHQGGSYAVPIPGLTSLGQSRVDLFNIYQKPSGLLDASGTNVLNLAIPPDGYLAGLTFDVQSVDLNLFSSTLYWASNDAEVSVAIVPDPALNMVLIAAGTFQMGSTLSPAVESPVHAVTITRPFWMGAYEVTQAEYQAVMGSNPSVHQGASYPSAPQHPVETVSWNSAMAYCAALTATEAAAGRIPAGYQYRLPTEAEWEYVCRAGTVASWNTGASLDCVQANFNGCRLGRTTVVGSYPANPWGLHDMHGNVWEWCLDSWDGSANYPSSAVSDPYVSSGPYRVYRGGGWSSSSLFCRSWLRSRSSPGYTSPFIGFRVCLAPVLVP